MAQSAKPGESKLLCGLEVMQLVARMHDSARGFGGQRRPRLYSPAIRRLLYLTEDLTRTAYAFKLHAIARACVLGLGAAVSLVAVEHRGDGGGPRTHLGSR